MRRSGSASRSSSTSASVTRRRSIRAFQRAAEQVEVAVSVPEARDQRVDEVRVGFGRDAFHRRLRARQSALARSPRAAARRPGRAPHRAAAVTSSMVTSTPTIASLEQRPIVTRCCICANRVEVPRRTGNQVAVEAGDSTWTVPGRAQLPRNERAARAARDRGDDIRQGAANRQRIEPVTGASQPSHDVMTSDASVVKVPTRSRRVNGRRSARSRRGGLTPLPARCAGPSHGSQRLGALRQHRPCCRASSFAPRRFARQSGGPLSICPAMSAALRALPVGRVIIAICFWWCWPWRSSYPSWSAPARPAPSPSAAPPAASFDRSAVCAACGRLFRSSRASPASPDG